MKRFATYDPGTGAITAALWTLTVETAGKQLGPGEALYEGTARDDIHYIEPTTGERMDRQTLTPQIAITEGQAALTNLPDPCEVRCLGVTAEATGGSITIEFDEPGMYGVELRARPQYLDHILEVDIP